MGLTSTLKDAIMGHEDYTNLRGLFINGVKDMYFAEKALKKNLETMRESAVTDELSSAFDAHREETKMHIARLEQVFALLDLEPETHTCEAIKGLAAEAEEIMDNADDTVMDAGLIYAASAVEHYEIARYTKLAAWARKLGLTEATKLLQATLKEEQAASDKLDALAERGIDDIALSGDFAELRSNPNRVARRNASFMPGADVRNS